MAHSIAQYTGTRIDSSAKHIVACKTNHDLYTDMGNTEKDLTQNKYRYAMMKDEIVLNVNRMTKNGVNGKGEFRETYKLIAYPSVITTLGDKVTENLKQGIRAHYRNLTPNTITQYISYRDEAKQVRAFPYLFGMQGISVGTAYASDLSGDNVASVMIGGMATVLNGHFPCYTGELVQWYFDFEKGEFDSAGCRKETPTDGVENKANPGDREMYYRQRMFADWKETTSGKHNIAMIKPLRHRIKDNKDVEPPAYGDVTRVFGRVVNGGQAWEPIDVFLCNVFVPKFT